MPGPVAVRLTARMPAQQRGGASVLGAAALAVDHLDDLVLGAVRDVHTSVAGRVHGVLDLPLRRWGHPRLRTGAAHDAIAAVAYTGVATGLRGAALALRGVDRVWEAPRIDTVARGRFLVGAVNGLIGDRLAADGSPLAVEAAVRHAGADLPLEADPLAGAYPEPTDCLVVFVHGLCESEEVWERRSRPRRADGSTGPSYAARLAEDGWSPVMVRVNTGLRVAENGVALSSLVAGLRAAWPVPVRRIALVGHSMGGLVARAACAVTVERDRDWRPLVTDVVTLGTPHLGSPVERSIARGLRIAERLPELSPYSRVFGRRSAGVLDLHDGLPEDAAQLPRARYHLVAATLTRSARHPLAATVGDTLVPFGSAVGRLPGGDPLFPGADVLHVPRAGHFDLLNHDAVHAALRDWLHDPTAQAARPAPSHPSQESA